MNKLVVGVKRVTDKVERKKKISNNGITLIALVLTIIVLLILAGVSLNLISGSNGILNRATSAVNATKQAQLEEELQLSLAEIMMDYYIEGNGKTLQEYIIEQCNKPENNGMLEVGNGTFSSIDGELYYTDSNGNISMITVDNNGNISIEGSVSVDGTVNDTNPPSIFATVTTNSISLVIKDPLSGVESWAYSITNTEPNEWNEVSGKPKNHSETITGLTNGTTYYIWAKDANGNKSQVKEITTKNFDELNYDVTWEGAMATIAVKSPSSGVQYLNAEGNWVDYTNPVTTESGTSVQFKVTDGNNERTYEAVKPLKPSTVTYHGNGGSGDFTETAEHTTNVSVNFATKPTRTNYEFVGWSKRADVGYADYSENGTNSFEMGTEDVNLYAIWKGTTKEMLNPANYGDKVNYSANGVSDWKIFSKDGNDIFLITEDCVTGSILNLGTGISINGNYVYAPNGTQNTLIDWMKDMNYWTNFVNSTYADQATGGATLEQLAVSANGKFGMSYTGTTIQSKKLNDALYKSSIYWWIASPCSDVTCVWWVWTDGQIYHGDTSGHSSVKLSSKSGIRPLVHLLSSVKMNWNGNAWDLAE